MQLKNWNDLRILLAVARGRSLAGAARLLGVDDTTVSRRLAALQAAAGCILCQRQGDGTLSLTERGAAIARRVEAMAHEVDLIGEELGAETDACAGSVRLTSVPIIVNRLLAPRVGALMAQHPRLDIELIADARAFSLTRREADLALRLARPQSGGGSVKARRIGYLNYSAYAAHGLTPKQAAALPWIGYGEAMAHVPQAGWMARAARRPGGRLTGLRVHDAETALEAAVAGLGRTLLPDIVVAHDPRLIRLMPEAGPEPPRRELWLLAQADQLPLTRIRAVIMWLEEVMAAARG